MAQVNVTLTVNPKWGHLLSMTNATIKFKSPCVVNYGQKTAFYAGLLNEFII